MQHATLCDSQIVRLQAMKEFVDEVDRDYLRPLQKDGFLCGANCCDNSVSQEDLQNWCVTHSLKENGFAPFRVP